MPSTDIAAWVCQDSNWLVHEVHCGQRCEGLPRLELMIPESLRILSLSFSRLSMIKRNFSTKSTLSLSRATEVSRQFLKHCDDKGESHGKPTAKHRFENPRRRPTTTKFTRRKAGNLPTRRAENDSKSNGKRLEIDRKATRNPSRKTLAERKAPPARRAPSNGANPAGQPKETGPVYEEPRPSGKP